MEDRNTETKDIEQGMVMAADVTDIRLAQAGYYWDAGYNEFDFSCKINGEKDIIHMVQQRHDDGYGLVIRAEKNDIWDRITGSEAFRLEEKLMCLIGYSDTIKKANFILIYRGIFMREKFSYNEFLDLIEKNEWQADKYKSKLIPNHLYKYQPIGSGGMRTKRIQTIKKEEIWASRVKYLNDPFEFKMLYANQENDEIREFYEDV